MCRFQGCYELLNLSTQIKILNNYHLIWGAYRPIYTIHWNYSRNESRRPRQNGLETQLHIFDNFSKHNWYKFCIFCNTLSVLFSLSADPSWVRPTKTRCHRGQILKQSPTEIGAKQNQPWFSLHKVSLTIQLESCSIQGFCKLKMHLILRQTWFHNLISMLLNFGSRQIHMMHKN